MVMYPLIEPWRNHSYLGVSFPYYSYFVSSVSTKFSKHSFLMPVNKANFYQFFFLRLRKLWPQPRKAARYANYVMQNKIIKCPDSGFRFVNPGIIVKNAR